MLRHIKMTFLLLFVLFGMNEASQAQYVEFEWSEEYRFTNKKSGFFRGFLGTNYNSIYLLQSNIAKSKPYENAKLKLVALNKNSLVEDTIIALKGFPENESNAAELNQLDYLKTIITEEAVFVFWRKITRTEYNWREEVFAQSFSSSLKPRLALKKVYEFEYEVDHNASIFDPSRCVVVGNSEVEKIVVGAEVFADEKLSFQFVTVDGKLNASSKKSFLLPHKLKELPRKTAAKYELRKNGMLYANAVVAYTNMELEGKAPDHPRTYLSLTIANPQTAKFHHVAIQGENKTITDFSYQDIAGKTRVIGFFGDVEQDTTGIDDQGVFYVDVDDVSLASSGIQFVYFERSIKNRIMSKRDRKKRFDDLPMDEVLNTRFDIEHIEAMEDSSMVVFFTMEYNTVEKWSRSDLNGENVYLQSRNFKKTNVYALRFANDGTVMWARDMERNASYEEHDAQDIQVVFKHDEFFVMFGNENPKLKSHRKKKLRHLKTEIEYATFDPNSGRAKVYEVEVNEPKTMLKDLRYIDPRTAVAIDGAFYFHQIFVRQNPRWTAANVVFVPTLYYTILTGNTQLGSGDFATMKIMPGRKPRRR